FTFTLAGSGFASFTSGTRLALPGPLKSTPVGSFRFVPVKTRSTAPPRFVPRFAGLVSVGACGGAGTPSGFGCPTAVGVRPEATTNSAAEKAQPETNQEKRRDMMQPR